MSRAILLALALAGCATPMAQTAPEPPRLRCINMGALPPAPGWFVYLCTFSGSDEPQPSVSDLPTSIGES